MNNLLLILFLYSTAAFSGTNQRSDVIYGDDNRKDLYEVTNPQFREWSRSTAAIFYTNSLSPMSSGDYFVQGYRYGEIMDLCPGERFTNQISAAICSGFLIAPDVLATAGHCINNQQECSEIKIVFQYANTKKEDPIKTVPRSQVYGCQSLIERKFSKRGVDYALIRLDRSVPDIQPLQLSEEPLEDKSAELVVMGHPAGLPLKITDQAFIRKSRIKKGHFTINSDTFAGNSGSAVINVSTGFVEGILVRGSKDYVKRRRDSCYVVKQCRENGCGGEDVTYSQVFSKRIWPE